MVVGSFLRDRIDGHPRASFADLVEGTAERPYAYRVLAPTAIRGLRELVPDATRTRIAEVAWRNKSFRETAERLKWAPAQTVTYLIATAIFWFSFLGFAAVFRRLLLRVGGLGVGLSRIWTLVAVAGLPVMFQYYSYIYDPTQLLLFTLGLLLLAERRWVAYLLAVVAATFSKETSILLIVLFAIHYRTRLARAPFLALLAAQLASFGAIKLWINARFADNPGGLTEFHLVRNLFLPSYEIADFLALVGIGVLVARRWHTHPPFLRDALWLAVPLLVLTFFLGYLDEYRDYYEIYPIVLALLGISISNLLREARGSVDAAPGDGVSTAR